MEKPFNCWQCGACCHFCHVTTELKHLDRGDGVCVHLTSENLCGIYEDRPNICNTRMAYKRFWEDQMTWNEYVDMSEGACRMLDGMVNGSE